MKNLKTYGYAILVITFLCVCIPSKSYAKIPKAVNYTHQNITYYGSIKAADRKRAAEIYVEVLEDKTGSVSCFYTSESGKQKILKAISLIQITYYNKEPFSYIVLRSAEHKGVIILNTKDMKDLKKKNDYISKKLISIRKKLKITTKTSTFNRVRKIEQYVRKNMRYDYSYKKTSLYDAIKYRKGTCMAYSALFMELCGQVGVKAECVTGNNGTHQWNKVSIKNKTYYVDTTWNDQLGKSTYTLLTKKQMIYHSAEYTTKRKKVKSSMNIKKEVKKLQASNVY